MFGLNLGKSITSIESWTRTLKNKSAIQDHLELVVSTVETVLVELKEDFNL